MFQGLHSNMSSGQRPSLNWGVGSETQTCSPLRSPLPLPCTRPGCTAFVCFNKGCVPPATDAEAGVTTPAEPRSQMYYIFKLTNIYKASFFNL